VVISHVTTGFFFAPILPLSLTLNHKPFHWQRQTPPIPTLIKKEAPDMRCMPGALIIHTLPSRQRSGAGP
jgi:hypothetical protein